MSSGWRADWAKGLTAQTDARVAKMAAARQGQRSWARGLTAADHPGIARNAEQRRGKKRGPYKGYGPSPWVRTDTRPGAEPSLLIPDDARPTYAYLLGLYLGDGSIVEKSHRLEIALDSRYPGLISSCQEAMRALHPRKRVAVRHRTNANCSIVSSYAWQWMALFPQHGPGRKHLRKIELREWQREIIQENVLEFMRGLMDSDGSRFARWVRGKNYPAYAFSNESTDIRRMFCWAADLAGIHYTFADVNKISIARRRDVALLDANWPPKGTRRDDPR